MKKVRVKFTALSLFFFLFVFNTHLFCDEQKVYNIGFDSNSYQHRLSKEMLEVAYERAGLKVRFTDLPLERVIVSANEGILDGDVGRIPDVEKTYKNLLRVPATTVFLRGTAYTVKDEIKFYDDTLLKKYKVGHSIGGKWSDFKVKGLKTVQVKNYDSLFQMLSEARLDMVLASETQGDNSIENLSWPPLKIRKLYPYVYTENAYHYLHEKNKNIVPKLEKAIRNIIQEGYWEQKNISSFSYSEKKALVFYTGTGSPLYEILNARIEKIFQRIGKKAVVKKLGSAQRALISANEHGDGDAIRIINLKKLYPKNTQNLKIVTQAIEHVEYFIYSNDAKILEQLKTFESLKRFKTGYRIGVKSLEDNIKDNKIVMPDTKRLFKMLHANRLDAVIEHGIIADKEIRQQKLNGIFKAKTPFQSKKGYIFIHKKYENLIPQINATIKAMKIDGSFRQIKEDILNNSR